MGPLDRPFAVIGATGQQGSAVVDALLERSAAVRALVRDPASPASKALANRGVELALADQADSAALRLALRDVAGLFLMTTFDDASGGTEAEVLRGGVVAEAASVAGVPHVVYSSVGGADRESGVPHFESKRRVELRLRELVPTSIVRPTFFMENLLRGLGDAEVVLRLPIPSDVPLQMIAVRDIGIISAAALLDPALVPADGLEIAGDTRTASEMATAIASVLRRPARFESLPLGAVAADTDRTAMFRWFSETPAYRADFETTRRLDPEVLDLRGWLRSLDTSERRGS